MDEWQKLQSVCSGCTLCRLRDQRHNVVFGDGNCHADIMLIGEGPGEQEDLQGIPFVGPAGKLLDDMLSIIDFDRRSYYITNIVKCRPPHNRDPQPEEQEACIGYLMHQIRMVQPKMIICLGRIAAQRFLGGDFRITSQHGRWYTWQGIPMTALYHPSALLRDTSKRPDTFVDLLNIRAKIQELSCNVISGEA